MITKQDDVRETEEWEEEMVTTIMAETKKTLARARRLKEIEVIMYYRIKMIYFSRLYPVVARGLNDGTRSQPLIKLMELRKLIV